MKTTRLTAWLGTLVFSLGVGCGSADSAVGTDVSAVTGSAVSGEQLALPDGDGPCARDKAGPAARSELSQLEALLALSADQISQLQPILDATRTALEDLRAQVKAGTLSAADAEVQVKALHDAQKTKILALLTPEQQAKFTQLRDHHSGPFDLPRLTAALGLSTDQVSQISALMSAAQTEISDVNAQVEAGTLAVADAHTQIDQILQASRTAIQAVLTADQQAELAKLMAAHRPRGMGEPRPARAP
jgi:Spy/CpxP family protein refolding chaperone